MYKSYYYTSLFPHSMLLFQPSQLLKSRSMPSPMLIPQYLKQLKVKLWQNFHNALTDINQELSKSVCYRKKYFLQHNKNQGLILMLQTSQFMVCPPRDKFRKSKSKYFLCLENHWLCICPLLLES